MLRTDAASFWHRVTGQERLTVPRAVARSYVKSLLFLFDADNDDDDDAAPGGGGGGGGEGSRSTQRERTRALLTKGVAAIGLASGGFSDDGEAKSSNGGGSGGGGCFGGGDADGSDDGGPGHADASGGGGRLHAASPVPNLIQGWADDEHLAGIVRSTPLVVSLAAVVSSWATAVALRSFGWRPGPSHAQSGLQCWVFRQRRHGCVQGPDDEGEGEQPPLVLLPGAGNGLLSFLPVLLLFQRRLKGRTLIVFRLPHVEVRAPPPLP